MAEQLEPVLDVEPVLALRMWIWCNGRLYARTAPVVWPPRQVMKSRCTSGESPPHEMDPCYGLCGLYAVAPEVIRSIVCVEPGHFLFNWGLRDNIEHTPLGPVWRVLAGLVALWGRVIRGTSGVYRAEYGYPVAIFAGPSDQDVAKEYGIPVLPVPRSVEDLQDACRLVRAGLAMTRFQEVNHERA